MADKWFGGIFVARNLQEKVLEFSGDSPNIKDTISPLHPFQVYPNDAKPMPKEEVRWSCIPVNEHLLVFPHPWLFAPAITQPGKLLDLIPGNALFFGELSHEPVEVGTIFVKIYPIAVCRPVVKCGQEICQGGELFIEPVWLSIKNSVCDDVAQRLPTAVLLNQQAVQPAIAAERTYDIVRVSYQSITAYQVQIVEFLLHVLIFPWHMKATMAISCKELSNHLHVTLLHTSTLHCSRQGERREI